MNELKLNSALGNSVNEETPLGSLSQKVVKGSFWVLTLRVLTQLFTIIRLIVLARILAPSDFGLMGIALLVMSTLEAFSNTGFKAALVQKKKDIKEYLDTAWTFLVLRGFFLFAILFFSNSSPPPVFASEMSSFILCFIFKSYLSLQLIVSQPCINRAGRP